MKNNGIYNNVTVKPYSFNHKMVDNAVYCHDMHWLAVRGSRCEKYMT
ncbi:hypothetical protein KS4_20770 [Poriferisphaera corsica]|uniref:Uncharacterized protein n=1 Tax=Poriferisphaera corsica TaxID=2528020 RepID=A0A517YUX5_9BACT|nr:hypothetical protein KS4_20770 [Poriferisphaera corsica]